MNAEPDLSRVARAIGDATRIRMLTLLMEGRALTAKELAYGSGVQPATATAHLHRLLDDSLVVCRTQGRHKYFRLASPQVARCVESLMVVAAPGRRAGDEVTPIRLARFCYDHLAGRVAAQMTRAWLTQRLLREAEGSYALTAKGARWCEKFGLDLAALSGSRRRFAYPCLDWSERQDHLGGALGAALAAHLVEREWLRRQVDSRVAEVTPKGRRALTHHFGVCWP